MTSKYIFSTPRLIIRQLCLSYLPEFTIMQGNTNVMQYIKPAMNAAESKKELNRFIDNYNSESFYNIWAVIKKDDNSFIGICGVYKNMGNEYELAYRLMEKSWGAGYGSEIAENLIEYCFRNLELNDLVAYAYTENIGSIKILENYMQFIKEEPHDKTGVMGREYRLKKTEP